VAEIFRKLNGIFKFFAYFTLDNHMTAEILSGPTDNARLSIYKLYPEIN